jgi:hypothetical protein
MKPTDKNTFFCFSSSSRRKLISLQQRILILGSYVITQKVPKSEENNLKVNTAMNILFGTSIPLNACTANL